MTEGSVRPEHKLSSIANSFIMCLQIIFLCSTRPFLDVTEKKWIVFQLLSALDQCHSVKVCH